MRNWLIAFSCLVIFQSCSSSEKVPAEAAQKTKAKPEWLSIRPTSSQYYIGVSKVSKSQFPENYSQEARKRALNDLGSEIEVKVETNSILFTFETSSGFTDDFVESIKLESSVKLEGYEMVDSYESASEYAVYYRLSKAKHQAIQKEKEDKAVNNAMAWVQKAELSKNNGDWQGEFKNLTQALSAVREFWNRPLQASVEGQKRFMSNYCQQLLRASAEELKLNLNPFNLRIAYGVATKSGEVSGKAMAYGKALVNLPLTARGEGLNFSKSEFKADGNGVFQVPSFYTAKSLESELVVSPDFLEMADGDEVLAAALKGALKSTWPECAISSQTPRVAFEFSGIMLEARQKSELQESLRKQSLLLESNPVQADLVIKIKIASREGGEYNGLFTTYLDIDCSVKDRNGKELFFKTYDSLKGVDLDYNRGQIKALQSFDKIFNQEILPQVTKKLRG